MCSLGTAGLLKKDDEQDFSRSVCCRKSFKTCNTCIHTGGICAPSVTDTQSNVGVKVGNIFVIIITLMFLKKLREGKKETYVLKE